MQYFILYLVYMVTSFAYAEEQVLIIIANHSVPIDHKLSIREIRNIYLLKKLSWSDLTPIVVINKKSGSPQRQQFEKKLNLSSAKYALYLKKMHYKGISLPIIQNSRDAVLSFVSKVPGAIAYINGPPPINSHIKIIGSIK